MEQRAVSPSISVPDTIAGLLAVGASVPLGQEGKIHVEGYNDMTTNQKLGIGWIVKDPDGIVAEEYSDWETWTTPPNDTHEFISPGSFDLIKKGTWTISIALFMNPDSPVTVDTYNGVLCVVSEVAFAGHISKKELEYDSVRGTIPVL